MPLNPARPPTADPAAQGVWSAGAALVPTDHWYNDAFPLAEENSFAGAPSAEAVSTESVIRHFGASYGLLERDRPDVASLARFAHRVEIASFYMCIAFQKGGVRDFVLDIDVNRQARCGASWFTWLADTTFCRFHLLRRALKHNWTPPAEVEHLTYSAFNSLCDLTPASGRHLKQLYISRREAAIDSLVNQLDLTVKLLEEAVALASQSDAAVHDRVAADDAVRLASIQAKILARAGDTLGLREAAKWLGTSHQNLHKRIRSGSALGVMRGRELVVPALQFIAEGEGWKIVPGLKQVLTLFEEARTGMWSALQFLAEHDPLLGEVPVERLKAGEVDAVVRAGRAYVGLDES